MIRQPTGRLMLVQEPTILLQVQVISQATSILKITSLFAVPELVRPSLMATLWIACLKSMDQQFPFLISRLLKAHQQIPVEPSTLVLIRN